MDTNETGMTDFARNIKQPYGTSTRQHSGAGNDTTNGSRNTSRNPNLPANSKGNADNVKRGNNGPRGETTSEYESYRNSEAEDDRSGNQNKKFNSPIKSQGGKPGTKGANGKPYRRADTESDEISSRRSEYQDSFSNWTNGKDGTQSYKASSESPSRRDTDTSGETDMSKFARNINKQPGGTSTKQNSPTSKPADETNSYRNSDEIDEGESIIRKMTHSIVSDDGRMSGSRADTNETGMTDFARNIKPGGTSSRRNSESSVVGKTAKEGKNPKLGDNSGATVSYRNSEEETSGASIPRTMTHSIITSKNSETGKTGKKNVVPPKKNIVPKKKGPKR